MLVASIYKLDTNTTLTQLTCCQLWYSACWELILSRIHEWLSDVSNFSRFPLYKFLYTFFLLSTQSPRFCTPRGYLKCHIFGSVCNFLLPHFNSPFLWSDIFNIFVTHPLFWVGSFTPMWSNNKLFFSVVFRPDSGSWPPSTGLRDHPHRSHHTRYDSIGRVISPTQRTLCHNKYSTTHIPPCPRSDSNTESQQASGRRPTSETARALGSHKTLYGIYFKFIVIELHASKNFRNW